MEEWIGTCPECAANGVEVSLCSWCTFTGCEACYELHECPGYPPDRIKRQIEALRGHPDCAVALDALDVAVEAMMDSYPDGWVKKALDDIERILGQAEGVPRRPGD